jgi:hypothetical protein
LGFRTKDKRSKGTPTRKETKMQTGSGFTGIFHGMAGKYVLIEQEKGREGHLPLSFSRNLWEV